VRVRLGTIWCVERYCAACQLKWRIVEKRARVSDRRTFTRTDRRAGNGPRWTRADLIAREPWDVVIRARTPILIIGPSRASGELIALLEPWLIEPVIHVPCGSDAELPSPATVGTVILHDADQLEDRAQREMVQWLDMDGHKTLVVSRSQRPLFPLVRTNRFVDTLYYRLNSFYIDLGYEARPIA
jgi:hypothetical protein